MEWQKCCCRQKGGKDQGGKLRFVMQVREKEGNINNQENPKEDDFLLYKIVLQQ